MYERLGPDLIRADGEFYRRLELRGEILDIAELDGNLYVLYAAKGAGRNYYSPIGKGAQQRDALHREVWKFANGPIPDGHVIHHIDGDARNNTLENLACITHSEHRQIHGPPMGPERAREHMAAIQEKAKEWHGSPEGLAWHREHGVRSWDNRRTRPIVCAECGETFLTRHAGEVALCSTPCRNAVAARNPDYYVARACIGCGETFQAWKWHAQRYCGRSCAGRANASKRRPGVQSDSG